MGRFLSVVLLCGLACTLTVWGQSQMELNQQAAKEAKKADDELNVVYKKLLAKARDETAKEKLRAAQRAWMQFRDAECEFEADECRGGSMQPMIYSGYLERITEARTQELRDHIKRLKEEG